ncbi:GNAT family N-acetyltransferase [Actinophytocola sp. KF-1]
MIEFRTGDGGPALHALWRQVFPDAGHVAPLYGQDPGRADRTFLAYDGDGPVAVVYWLPRQVRGLGGAVHLVGCVSSVATLPRARGQGLVRRLLAMAVESMTAHGCAWSLLFTGTPGVYAGWTVFDRVHVRGTFAAGAPERPGWTAGSARLDAWPVLADLHARSPRPLTTVRSPEDWVARVPVWYGRGHEILLVREHGTPVAYAVADWRTGDVVEFAARPDATRPLFEAVARAAGRRGVAAGRLLAPPEAALPALFATWSPEVDRTGMVRPLHSGAEEVMAVVTAPAAVHWTADYF